MHIKEFFLSWGMLLIGALMNVFGVCAVKMKINELRDIPLNSLLTIVNYFITLVKFPIVIVGAIFILAAPFPYAIALSKMELSVAYPVSVALNCFIILPLSVMFLGEGIGWSKAVGVGLVLLGLYFLYRTSYS